MLRLILLIVLLLISILVVFNAPTYHLWMLAIMAGEYSLIFIGGTMLLLLSGWWVGKYRLAGTLFGVTALLLFLWPIVSAWRIGKTLPKEMDKALLLCGAPAAQPLPAPFTFGRLFKNADQQSYKTVTYVSYPDISLTLDYYVAAAKGKRPCVVVIHGGSWSSGDSRQLPELNTYLAKAGYQVASINYRLSPKWKSPAPVQDVDAALTYLRNHADELQIDISQFVLLGRSAGAQVALLAGYTLPHAGIKAVVDFYGPADMVWGYSVPASKLVMDSRRVMANYLGGYYPQAPQNYAASSPIEFVNRQTVPTLIIHGGNDVLVAYEHSRRLDAKLQSNGIPHYWLQLHWATHGFDYHLNGPGGQLSAYAVNRFLQSVVK
ncbi:alpha/beta hydrolase [Mucilaginibacter sp. Bleaf8]|uniref:alpha/beta hydrolase n=1 Tax=Mucilaginibacter sp. Bleaf8 TaxID=2834430 RepID=UPI001BD0CFD4|nr:alpha/beta hydrolase [Mucilaginibacter sp. Bleaf8]MBS7564625.1 alpha/beta hydrolase [Mucilaginibacter sp. Bleaf8]